jgi:hypothetical protein
MTRIYDSRAIETSAQETFILIDLDNLLTFKKMIVRYDCSLGVFFVPCFLEYCKRRIQDLWLSHLKP